MFYFLTTFAHAADPSSLGSSPPSGADLTRTEEGWRFERPVEIDGKIVFEQGLAVDGRIRALSWTAGGEAADALTAWYSQRAPQSACPGADPSDRWVAVSDGVVFQWKDGADRAGRRVTASQSLDAGATCEALLPPKVRQPPKTALKTRPPPAPVTTSPSGGWSADDLPFSSVVRDPAPEVARRLRIEAHVISELPVRRIVGWCLATYPATGTFRWETSTGVWKAAPDQDPSGERLLACTEALLAPMLAQGDITVHISPEGSSGGTELETPEQGIRLER